LNYFAHARIATSLGGDDAHVLGAMLPDFAHIVGIRIDAIEHASLSRGASLHHRTDSAFHATRAYRILQREGVGDLEAAGLGRGPARGAAHVGIELLLDVALTGDPDGDAGYLRALAAAPALADAIRWSDERGASRWKTLHTRLVAAGTPSSSPERIAERVARALASRPRLRLAPKDLGPVALWLAASAGPVERAAPLLLEQTLAGLDDPNPPQTADRSGENPLARGPRHG